MGTSTLHRTQRPPSSYVPRREPRLRSKQQHRESTLTWCRRHRHHRGYLGRPAVFSAHRHPPGQADRVSHTSSDTNRLLRPSTSSSSRVGFPPTGSTNFTRSSFVARSSFSVAQLLCPWFPHRARRKSAISEQGKAQGEEQRGGAANLTSSFSPLPWPGDILEAASGADRRGWWVHLMGHKTSLVFPGGIGKSIFFGRSKNMSRLNKQVSYGPSDVLF